MEYLNEGKHLTTSDTTIITSGASTKLLIKTIHATNITSSETTLSIYWTDNSSGENFYLGKDLILPESSSFQALDGTLALDNLDSLVASCGDVDAVDLTVSYMLIDNSEG